MILTPLKKSKAPDFSEARPYRRAGYIRPRRHQFLHDHDNHALSYLLTPVVGVSAGVCVPPAFGITVSFMVVDGILGL